MTVATVKVATWNVNSLTARMPRVVAWLERQQADILLIQETKCSDATFPGPEFSARGYLSAHHGEGRWNGVAILSRVGLDRVERGLTVSSPQGTTEGRYISADCGGLRVASVYVPNGRELSHPHFQYKLAFLAELAEVTTRELRAAPRGLLVGGDFNVAPTDADVYDPAAFVGLTHVSPEERAALARVQEAGLADLATLGSDPPGFTYWDYRQGFFRRGLGMRIDLLLGSPQVASRATPAEVDREERRGERPSDHAPLSVDLAPDA